MSYQTQPAVVITQSPRIRNENAQSIGGLSGGTKDLLMTGAALAAGAFGGYFLLDYLFKNNILDKINELIPGGDSTVPAEGDDEGTESNIAYTLPYDRTTRINSYGNTGISAYRGQKVLPRLPTSTTTDEVEINFADIDDDPGFNQIFTDNEVYEVV